MGYNLNIFRQLLTSKAEPNYDIMVWASTGYDGVVRLNGADFQLTQDTNDTELWYGTAPSSVTAMDDFLKHRNSTYYNSNSIYIKEVRFGSGMYAKTASCTTLLAAFNCSSSDTTNFSIIDVTNLNTSNVTTMQACFADIIHNTILIKGYEDWDVNKVTTFNYIFSNINLGNDIIDLHKWHILSNATIVSMLGGLGGQSLYNSHYKVYYTPGYWGKDPMNTSNLATDRVKPVVYPYHDINIAATSSFNGNVRINDTNIATTKDNNLGIWYYDIPSQGELTQINLSYGSSSKAYITSISIGDRFANQETSFNTWSAFADCENLRTVSIPEGMDVNLNQTFKGSGLSTPVLCGVYGFDKIKIQSQSGGQYTFQSQSALRYVDIAPVVFTSYYNYLFSSCTNLIRIKNLPGLESAATADSPFYGCTSLTTIDNAGPISKTLSFSDSPLTLDSAKVILSALQTVTSETLTFSSATCDLIQADTDAKQLVVEAIAKGWTVQGVDVSIPSITGQQMYDIFYSGAASDTNVWVTIKFNLNNPGGYEITKCGVCRARTINPNASTVTTTTDAGAKSVNLSGHTYNNTYYFRSFVTFKKFDGTSQTVFADNLIYTPQYVLSRQSASGTSGSCSVRTNGSSATNIYVNVRCNCYPVATYNTSSYSLKWELRRSSVTGTVICSGTASYQSGVTAFYTHGNVTMSNANTTKYTHYLIFYRSDDTSHKVYYVSNNTFAEKGTADEWTLFHYSGKSY